MYIYIPTENLCFLALGANSSSHFLAQVFFGNYPVIRVFRVLDWLSSISGAKSTSHKTEIG